MPATLLDRITPTAAGVVSRAWVIGEVERHRAIAAERHAEAIDALCTYEPPRRSMRDNMIVWVGLLGAAMLADVVGLPGWSGFVAALGGFTLLARVLAVRVLRWRLARWVEEDSARDSASAAAHW